MLFDDHTQLNHKETKQRIFIHYLNINLVVLTQGRG